MNIKIDNGAWLKEKCPNIWSLLNHCAQSKLPNGIDQYMSPPPLINNSLSAEYLPKEAEAQAEQGKANLIFADKTIKKLIENCGLKSVGDTYRRDMSAVSTESQLAELLCEITLCSAISSIASDIHLRPPSRKGTSCDISFQLQNYTIYGEVKRYKDKEQFCRSITRRGGGLRDKLCNVPRQFPDDKINLVFVFHPSYGESMLYIQQALFEPNGLFAMKAISGCCYIEIKHEEGVLHCHKIWTNPNALIKLPLSIHNALKTQTLRII